MTLAEQVAAVELQVTLNASLLTAARGERNDAQMRAALYRQQLEEQAAPLPYRWDRKALAASPKKVGAYYMPQNVSDLNTRLDLEVKKAWDAGIDFWIVDGFDFRDNYQLANVKRIIAACERHGQLKVALMVDLSADPGVDLAPAELLERIDALDSPALRAETWAWVNNNQDGPDRPASWWRDFQALDARPLIPVFLSLPDDLAEWDFAYSFASWGGPAPWGEAARASLAQNAGRNIERGKPYIAPVRVQAVYQRDKTYWEAGNSETLRGMWKSAIDNKADMVTIPTWNDYDEGTQIDVQEWLDLSGYWLAWWKLGRAPTLTREGAYLIGRTQKGTAPGMLLGGTMGPRDMVEVVTFLKTLCSGRVNARALTAPAGVSAKTFPLDMGILTVELQRGNVGQTLHAPWFVLKTPPTPDLLYRICSSLRP